MTIDSHDTAKRALSEEKKKQKLKAKVWDLKGVNL